MYRDELCAQAFYSRCDNKGPTLTIIKSKGYLFGGYNPQSWDSPEIHSPSFHPSSFIFTLTNPHGIPPTKYGLKKASTVSIWRHLLYGIVFGGEESNQEDICLYAGLKNT